MSASASNIRVVPAGATGAVGRYRYIAALAEGGMADVYLAVTSSAGFEKLVVIKQLRASLAEDPSFVTMFTDEARLAARLNHPNVVQTLEVGQSVGNGGIAHFLAMEFLEGVPYVRFARLRDRIPPPLAFHLRILVDVLRGLHYAHELRDFDGKPLHVVHRDVSPQNVMLTWAGGVKVLDFGIAKAALAVEQCPEDFKGKLEYTAPEQAVPTAGAVVDRRADVFAVGVMLWEALTRRRLYERGEDKLARLLSGRLPAVLEVRPDASKRLAAICHKAMAHDPADRYATAEAMADELEEWLGSTTQHVTARDVGSFVAGKFASTRAKIAAAIEAQLKLFRDADEDDDDPKTIPIQRLPDIELPDLSDLPPPPAGWAATIPPGGGLPAIGAFAPDATPSAPAGPAAADPAPASPAVASASPATAPTPRGTLPLIDPGLLPPELARLGAMLPSTPATVAPSVPPEVGPSSLRRGPEGGKSSTAPGVWIREDGSAAGGAVSSTSSRPPRRPRSTATVTVAALFLCVIAAAGIAAAVHTKSRAEPTAASVPREAKPLDEEILVTIKVTPTSAKIVVDGQAVPNPAVLRRARDTADHVVRVDAQGYEPREEVVQFGSNLLVTLELRPRSDRDDAKDRDVNAAAPAVTSAGASASAPNTKDAGAPDPGRARHPPSRWAPRRSSP